MHLDPSCEHYCPERSRYHIHKDQASKTRKPFRSNEDPARVLQDSVRVPPDYDGKDNSDEDRGDQRHQDEHKGYNAECTVVKVARCLAVSQLEME